MTFPDLDAAASAPSTSRVQPPAHRAGDRPGSPGPLGGCGRDEPEDPRARARTPRRRTASRRRSGSSASSAPRASTTRPPSRSTRRTGSPSATSTGCGSSSSRPASGPCPAIEGSKAPVSIFVEETGKTGFAFLTDLADPKKLAQVNPGDSVELTPEGNRLIAWQQRRPHRRRRARASRRASSSSSPNGNKYAAGVTSLGDQDVRIIIREIFQDPRNYGKVSFPTAAKSVGPPARTRRARSCARRGARGGPRGRRGGRGDRGPRSRPPGRGHRRRGVRRGARRARRGAVGAVGLRAPDRPCATGRRRAPS